MLVKVLLRYKPRVNCGFKDNAWVTRSGGEMSLPQVVQAQAARVGPEVDMNPILLKPLSDTVSQLIIHGKAITNVKASDYFNSQYTNQLLVAVESSLQAILVYFVRVLSGLRAKRKLQYWA